MSGSERARRTEDRERAHEARKAANDRYVKALANVNEALRELDDAREAFARADSDFVLALSREHWTSAT